MYSRGGDVAARAGDEGIDGEDAALAAYRRRRPLLHSKFDAAYPDAMGEFDFLEPVELSAREIQRILSAARAVDRIYRRADELLRQSGSETLSELGLPRCLRELAPLQNEADTARSFGRVDLVRGPRSYKMLEYNTDSPGFLIAAFALTGFLCRELGLKVPHSNRIELLAAGVRRVLGSFDGHARVAFGYGEDEPTDRLVAEYLKAAADLHPEIRSSCPTIESLRFKPQGLFDAAEDPIAALWHTSPWENFLIELGARESDAKVRVLKGLLDGGKLDVVGTPGAALLQSKAVQALIWRWFEHDRCFSPRERALIREHMLPTSFDPIPGAKRQVVKPVLGVAGDSIRVIGDRLETLVESEASRYRDQVQVYQEYIELPKARLLTDLGWKDLQVAASCFIVGGRACGVLLRAGVGITDSDWWVVPVAQSR